MSIIIADRRRLRCAVLSSFKIAAATSHSFNSGRVLESFISMILDKMWRCFLAAVWIEHQDIKGGYSTIFEEQVVSFLYAVSTDKLIPAGPEDYSVGIIGYSNAPCFATRGLQIDVFRDVPVEIVCKSIRCMSPKLTPCLEEV